MSCQSWGSGSPVLLQKWARPSESPKLTSSLFNLLHKSFFALKKSNMWKGLEIRMWAYLIVPYSYSKGFFIRVLFCSLIKAINTDFSQPEEWSNTRSIHNYRHARTGFGAEGFTLPTLISNTGSFLANQTVVRRLRPAVQPHPGACRNAESLRFCICTGIRVDSRAQWSWRHAGLAGFLTVYGGHLWQDNSILGVLSWGL